MVRTRLAMGVCAVGILACAGRASADEARVSVGPAPEPYARPPRPATPIAVDEGPDERPFEPRETLLAPRPYRAPFRFEVGPASVTTGQGLGVGLGVAASFGRGTVGARVAAGFLRGEVQDPDAAATASLGHGLAQYTGELTLDLNKRGPIHPVLGVGLGLAHVRRGERGGNAGIGTGRIAIEYALGLEDADVRVGAGLTGALAGPADRAVEDLRGYALLGASLVIGF